MRYVPPPGPGALQTAISPRVPQRGLPWIMRFHFDVARLLVLLIFALLIRLAPIHEAIKGLLSLSLVFANTAEGSRIDYLTRPAFYVSSLFIRQGGA